MSCFYRLWPQGIFRKFEDGYCKVVVAFMKIEGAND